MVYSTKNNSANEYKKGSNKMMIFRRFCRNEDGGADQLIIAAILIVIGIGVALLFGDQIKSMVQSLLDKPELPTASDYYTTEDSSKDQSTQTSNGVHFIEGESYSLTYDGDIYSFIDEQDNVIVLTYTINGEHYALYDNSGRGYKFITSNSSGIFQGYYE